MRRDTHLTELNLSVAAYASRRAAYHAARGNIERANECLFNARAYDTFAKESDT